MTTDIIAHISTVQASMERIIQRLRYRAEYHDASKLKEPEYSVFKLFSARLKDTKFGTQKYYDTLNEPEFQEALNHHYKHNSHHPQHNDLGLDGMSLIDITEMLCDWYSASGAQGNSILQSLKIQKERFGMSDQLYNILVNTVKEMEWQ